MEEEENDDVVAELPVEPAPRPPPAADRGDRWFDGNGYRVRYDPDYVAPSGVRFSANWQLKCTNPLHRKCFKKKHVNDGSTKDCGEVEPLAFLHAWAELDTPAGERHSLQNPDQDVVIAYAAVYGEELRAILDRRPVYH